MVVIKVEMTRGEEKTHRGQEQVVALAKGETKTPLPWKNHPAQEIYPAEKMKRKIKT